MKTAILVVLISTLLLGSRADEPKRILLLFTYPEYSLYSLGKVLGEGLANAGFEVTIVSAFEVKNPPKNYRNIEIDGLKEHLDGGYDTNYLSWGKSKIAEMLELNVICTAIAKFVLEHPKITHLLAAKNESFDAVIVEQILNDAFKGFASHFKAPLIVFTSVGPFRWVNDIVGNPEPPSYIPSIFLNYSHEMGFFQRMYNFVFALIDQLLLHYYVYPTQAKFLKQHFPNSPDFYQLLYNASIVLLNFHESVGQPVPQVPNMINIGGFHIKTSKGLPKHLQDFLNEAKEGVIYFSLGSFITPSQMSNGTRDAILKALGSRKEKVLWKWDQDSLPNKPPNVRIYKWFPQQDILNHPNVKLFITHCGLLSTTETTYFGVPTLGLPVFAEQEYNAVRASYLGIGKFIRLFDVNHKNFHEALTEVLENPKYRQTVKHCSRLMRDRPVKPMDLVIYWVDYVIRHKGAPHLRVAGVDLPFYKYLMLDVLAAMLFSIFLSIYVLVKIVNYFRNGNKPKKLKQK